MRVESKRAVFPGQSSGVDERGVTFSPPICSKREVSVSEMMRLSNSRRIMAACVLRAWQGRGGVHKERKDGTGGKVKKARRMLGYLAYVFCNANMHYSFCKPL